MVLIPETGSIPRKSHPRSSFSLFLLSRLVAISKSLRTDRSEPGPPQHPALSLRLQPAHLFPGAPLPTPLGPTFPPRLHRGALRAHDCGTSDPVTRPQSGPRCSRRPPSPTSPPSPPRGLRLGCARRPLASRLGPFIPGHQSHVLAHPLHLRGPSAETLSPPCHTPATTLPTPGTPSSETAWPRSPPARLALRSLSPPGTP